MQFYIYQNSAWVEKKANLMAVSESVKDETLDTAQVEIYFDDSKTPYPPRTLCKMVTQYYSGSAQTKTDYYHIATDSVGVQTIKPRTYKHTITLVQTTRKLSHFILPNMVITKPREAVAKTYFCNENGLNLLFYDHSFVNKGPFSWRGFTTRYVIDIGTDNYRKTSASPYWGECVALSSRSKFARGVIKIHFDAIVATATYSSGAVSNAKATFTRLARDIAHPDWLTPYIQVYWCQGNANVARTDSALTKTIIEKVPLSSVTWSGGEGYINLSSDAIAQINGYSSGYIMCELISEVTGNVPTELHDPVDNVNVSGAYDRLFCDYTEFLTNNIQTIWSNVSLELSYKQDSLYEVLNRILLRQQCKHSKSTNEQLFSLPTSGEDYDILTGTEAPEFSFVNLTVFEAVSKVLETIDALPKFTCDDNGKLTLELDYLSATGVEISDTQRITSYASSATEQKRDNGILTNFQGAETLCNYPCPPMAGKPSFARARVSSYGIPTATDFVLAVDKPIKYVNHLWVKSSLKYQVAVLTGYVEYTESGTTISVPRYTYSTPVEAPVYVDIASFVFDDTVYSSALSQGVSYAYSYTQNYRSQFNCLKFKKGSKNIDIGVRATDNWNKSYWTFWNCLKAAKNRAVGAYAQNYDLGWTTTTVTSSVIYDFATASEADFKNIWFACEYASDIDGRLEVQSPFAKEEGQFLASTGSTSPDLSKLGLNMMGISLRSGEPTMTCTQVLSDWGNCLKVGQVYRENDETWIVTKASYSTLTTTNSKASVIKGTIEFTKNFNGLAKRIGIDQSKRLYNIDRGIASLCEMNITNYLYFETAPSSVMSPEAFECDILPFTADTIGKIILKAISPISYSRNAYRSHVYQEVGFAVAANSSVKGSTATDYLKRYIPLSIYGAGNCLCFETKFDDPISAGVKMTASSDGSTYWWATDTYQKAFTNSTYYYGTDVKYADDEGYANNFIITYYADQGSLDKLPDTLPDCTGLTGQVTMGAISGLKFDKQPNEIFGLNYELAFLSRYHKQTNEVFFGRRFFQAWGGSSKKSASQLRFYYSKTDKYTYGSQNALGSYLPLAYCSSDTAGSTSKPYGFIGLTLLAPYAGYTQAEFGITSWGIGDENGNLLIGCNCDPETYTMKFEKGKSISLPHLYFFTKLERL